MTDYIYPKRERDSKITLFNDDYRNIEPEGENIIVVTDPPFNIGFKYNKYSDSMEETSYYNMLTELLDKYPCVFIHYPDALYHLAVSSGKVPDKVCSWVYNSNMAKQHRDIAYFGVKPDFSRTFQPYKNLNDKRIQERIARGCVGSKIYDWWYADQVKNVNRDKTGHPCQMPLSIMKNIVSSLPTNCTVFDPFMGSGTTGVACKELGYDFIGVDVDEDYYKIAENRIKGGNI